MSRRSLLTVTASALIAASLSMPAIAQSPSAPAASGAPAPSIPTGPAIMVVATDYHFGGLPTTVPVGTTITLDNQGAEVHEIAIVRKNDGVTMTWDELLAKGPGDEVFQYITDVGALSAGPGETAEGAIVIAQEGDYFAVCFIPQGTTSMEEPASPAPRTSAAPEGPPHFVLGMRQEFTVTAAGSNVGPMPSPMPMGSMAPVGSAEPMETLGASPAP